MMSTRKQHIAIGLIGAVVFSIATIAAIVPREEPADRIHEIHLVVRDMTYYVEGNSEPNPTLTVRRGEQVKVTVRNDEAGMIHDFGVGAWNARTARLEYRELGAVQFRAPDQPGIGTYACSPHAEMMQGTIRVE
jgi:plastocyanin